LAKNKAYSKAHLNIPRIFNGLVRTHTNRELVYQADLFAASPGLSPCTQAAKSASFGLRCSCCAACRASLAAHAHTPLRITGCQHGKGLPIRRSTSMSEIGCGCGEKCWG
jgi:hypothetical protein